MSQFHDSSRPSAKKRKTNSGGGWPAIFYSLRKAREVGGFLKFYKALRSRNACKTCALGMGGQQGGMVNEAGHFPEVCKKSMQAMAADMQGAIPREFFANFDFGALRRMSSRELEHAGRLVEPMLARAGIEHYEPISWEDAYAICTARLRETQADENFFYFSGRSSNEAGFLLQLFARLYGTNNVNNCSYYCHQASGVGLSSVFGTGTATVQLEDIEKCDTVFVIGGNPASNHPRLLTSLMKLRRRGGRVIIVNPLVEPGLVEFRVPSDPRSLLFGTKVATHYAQINIGSDIAFLNGVAKAIVEIGAHDRAFLALHTDESDALLDQLTALEWSAIERGCGMSRTDIEHIARAYARSNATIFSWTMGITHHEHGCDNVRAICNLALLRGMVGKPGAGMMPIRGHSNVQGIGSVGVTPALKDAILERLKTHYGITPPATVGMDTMQCIHAMEAGTIRNAWCLGGNLFGSNPHADATREAFGKLDFACYLSTTLNTGHAHGRAKETLILPMLARDEEPQATTQESMFNFVRLSDGGPARHAGPRSEVEVIATIARNVLGDDGPLDWRSMQETRRVREAIAKVIPGYEAIGKIDETKQEFQIGGRTFHTPVFKTASGRAQIIPVALPKLERDTDAFTLMTFRSEGQFNTVVYEEHDWYRGIDRRDVILMNAADMKVRGFAEDDLVSVRSETGAMQEIRVRAFAINRGNVAMYYPEANVLVPRDVDRESKTPAFKAVRVRVEREALKRMGLPVRKG